MLGSRYAFDGQTVINLSKSQVNSKEELLQNITVGKYRREEIKCECDSNSFELLSEKDRYGIPVKTVICKKCGLIRQNPRLNAESLSDFYAKLYRGLYESSSVSALFNNQLHRGKKIIKWINQKLGYLPEKVIEIGCGAGGILKAFQNMGCKTLGIDFNQKYLDFGIANGLDLRLGGTGVLKDYTADLFFFPCC